MIWSRAASFNDDRHHDSRLTSHPDIDRGLDIMVLMAIPCFGRMLIEIMTMLVVPVLYCSLQEWKIRFGIEDPRFAAHESRLAESC